MNLIANIKELLPLDSGTSAIGAWKRQDVVLETVEQYPKTICISVWNDKIDTKILQPGNRVQFLITIKSKEHNGKWYHDIRANKMELMVAKDPIVNASQVITQPTKDDEVPF
jgi:hypothetical protein